MRKALLPLLALASLTPLNPWTPDAAAAALIQEEAKGTFTNSKIGFKLKPPKGWNMVALKTDEIWLACKYTSDKSYFFHDKTTGRTEQHRPELKVIALIKANLEKKRKVEKHEGEEGDVLRVTGGAPFKDYDGYLELTMSSGFFLDDEKNKKIDGIDVDIYTYRVEKLSGAPRFIHTWIWRTDEIDYAVQMDVLQTEQRKLKKILDRTFKSFGLVERTEAGIDAASSWITLKQMNEGSPKERRSMRIKSELALRERATASLPKSWTTQEFGDILVLSKTDKRYTKKVGEHAKALRSWLESTFPYIGKGEYARQPIIRILDSREGLESFGSGARDTNSRTYNPTSGIEAYTCKDGEGFQGSAIDLLNRSITAQWMADKDRDLISAMPFWLRSGLLYVIAGARADGRKMKFRVDYDVVNARTYIAQGHGLSIKEILSLTRESMDYSTSASREAADHQITQNYSFCRYLISPEAKKNKLAKKFLETYILTLKEVVADQKSSDKDKYGDLESPETEEEEEQRAKAKQERNSKRAGETAAMVLDRGFGEWSEKDWVSLEKAFRKWL